MSVSQKQLGLSGCNIDIDPSLQPEDKARFNKALVWESLDPSNAGLGTSVRAGVRKSLQSTIPVENIPFPSPNGSYTRIGSVAFDDINEVYCFVHNTQKNHFIYRIRGSDGGVDLVYSSHILNFQLDSKYFIGEGQCSYKRVLLKDPITGNKVTKTLLQFSDGFQDNGPRQICVEDSIATNGFNANNFPYFIGTYDPNILINFGVPTPSDCITITPVSRDEASLAQPNDSLFKVLQVRISEIDVYGRPSEHGVISIPYIPGINDCISSSNTLPRCVDINFPITNPFVNSIQIEYAFNNADQWFTYDTIWLYQGSNIGSWWLRGRNTDGTFTFNNVDSTVTYRFCYDKECNPIPITETERIENPIPRNIQSVFSIGPYTALANNEDEFAPFSQDLLSKFSVSVIPPTKTDIQTAIIDIYVPIYNPFLLNYQSILKDGTNGFIWGDNDNKHNGARNYLQFFKNQKQSGFIGYLVGTGNYAISTQYFLDGSGNLIEDTTFNGLENSPRHIVFERFRFTNVPRGTYIFSIASHLSDPTVDSNWAATSTTLWGVCPFNGITKSINIEKREAALELEINVCDGNYNTLTAGEILVIADLAAFFPGPSGIQGILEPGAAVGSSAKATCGYIYETQENGTNQFPVELIGINNAVGQFSSMITDRNGFFWFDIQGTGRQTHFKYSYKCQTTDFHMGEGNPGMRALISGVSTGIAGAGSPIYLDNVGASGPGSQPALSPDYPSVVCNRILLKGTLTLEGLDIGIPNSVVAFTRGGIGITDDNGNYTIIVHDNLFPTGSGSSTGGFLQPRTDDIIFVPGGCNYQTPTGGCIPIQTITINPCTNCSQYTITNPRTFLVGTLILVALSQRGPLSGGTYGIGVYGEDLMGRVGFVQPLGYAIIPTIIQSQTIGPSQIQVKIDASAVFPSWVVRLHFCTTAEITLDAYIDWIVDRSEFIDNTGSINNDAPTQIRIYYASLIEYNKQNNFNTTTLWQFLAPAVQAGTAQEPFTSDKVQFFVNGDGTFFFSTEASASGNPPALITSLVKYDQTGQYFLVDYTTDLDNLQANALIRLARPKVCSDTEAAPYFDCCPVVPVQNLTTTSVPIILQMFDTYYLPRQIPVPTPINSTTPLNSTSITTETTAPVTSAGVTTQTVTTIPQEVTTNEQRSFGFLFEHNSPSNFWGLGAWSRGRENSKNPYETELSHLNEIALSGQLSPTGQLNYLNYFNQAQKFSFITINALGIVACLVQNARVLVICENDFFIVGFGDINVTTDSNGDVVAPTAGQQFGNPFPKVGNKYGCRLEDKSTISQYEGIAMYLDRNRTSVVRNDFQSATPVNVGQFDSYINPKVKFVHEWNLTNTQKRFFVGVINKINSSYLLTDYLEGSENFVNNIRDYNLQDSDTIEVDSRTGMLKGWQPFTPEGYASLEGAFKQKQLYGFTNGQANTFYTTDENRAFGTIFGTPVNRVYRVIMSLDNLKKKSGLSVAMYSHHRWFLDQVISESGQKSRTLLAYVRKALDFHYCPILCNVDTIPDPNIPHQTGDNAVLDGDNLYGTWIDVRMIGDPVDDATYIELQGAVVTVFAQEKTST